jgi:Helix-turn-helix
MRSFFNVSPMAAPRQYAGHTFSHYRIIEPIGSVGMGVVYRAHDERLNPDADICGLDRTYIGGIERGERNVSLVNIERIAQALKISIPRLFKKV